MWLYEIVHSPLRGIGLPVSLILKIEFHITDQRTVLVFQQIRILNIDVSQWFTGTSATIASDFIRSVAIKKQHFGIAKAVVLGIDIIGPFGIGRTPFDKSGGDVPYLEIVSSLPGTSRSKTTKIFMGIGEEAENELESAHNILLDKLQSE